MTVSMTGKLLVASSLVAEPVYAGGVCLVVHEDEDNVIGVMLNRPIKPDPKALLALLEQAQLAQDESLDDAWEPDSPSELSTTANRLDDSAREDHQLIVPSLLNSLHFGGPQSGPVVAIHQDQQWAEAETGHGIFVAATREHLENLVQNHDNPFRLIVGHMRWAPEQLHEEQAGGIWHCLPATRQIVFDQSSQMWHRLIRRATARSMANWIGTDDIVNAGELN